ncbi:hypothetical protein LCGC14_1714910 [marine sediment metagenome]|uniref:Uncharacterized protein n=1 Tax=marine sediment metagenome TaxID=412755 RepID=A0A0F9JUN9_9ZZZZ
MSNVGQALLLLLFLFVGVVFIFLFGLIIGVMVIDICDWIKNYGKVEG